MLFFNSLATFLPGTPHPGMPQVVLKKTEEAIADSDIVLFMIDARQGVTEADRHYARYKYSDHTMTCCWTSINGNKRITRSALLNAGAGGS